ncbi:MAG TPA: outer membrane protein assembly factor BamE [Leucothrix sp.]|nr:outer membrane protein assembly factor BamE [Leucothrix sp.]
MNKTISILLLSITLASCSIYKMDIQQGNSLSTETVSQLKLGMSKAEVASLLGTSLLQDNFRSNRWDYIYSHKKGRRTSKKQSITLHFQNDLLAKIKR